LEKRSARENAQVSEWARREPRHRTKRKAINYIVGKNAECEAEFTEHESLLRKGEFRSESSKKNNLYRTSRKREARLGSQCRAISALALRAQVKNHWR